MPKINVTQPLVAFDGENLKRDNKDFTIRTASTGALTGPLAEGDKPEQAGEDEKGRRYALACRLHAESEPDLSTDDIGRILHCVHLAYTGNVVYGAMLAALDPSKLAQHGADVTKGDEIKEVK